MLLALLNAAFALNIHDLATLHATPPPFLPLGVPAEDQASMVADELGDLGTVFVSETVDGPLYVAHLRGSPLVRGVPCAARVVVSPDGAWSCSLAAPWTVAGLDFPTGSWLRFSVSTSQLLNWSTRDTLAARVAGVPCRSDVEIGADGELRACVLDAPWRFPGTELLPAGAHVELSGGRLQGAVRASDDGTLLDTYDERGRVIRTEGVESGC
jgi:hypothetical protein